MDIEDLEKLVSLLEGSEVSEFEYEKDGLAIRINRASVGSARTTAVVAQQPQVVSEPMSVPAHAVNGSNGPAPSGDVDDAFLKVESPIVGTFYRKPNPDADVFVEVGSRVKKGQTLCIVEAMKLMNEIEAPSNGVIEKILLEDGNVVEYGEVLFFISPE